jgi:hypothetical protein
MNSKAFLAIFTLTLCLFTAAATRAADHPDFLKVGRAYRIAAAPNVSLPKAVLILEKGGGGWFHAASYAGETTLRQSWINLAYVASFTELDAEDPEARVSRQRNRKPAGLASFP